MSRAAVLFKRREAEPVDMMGTSVEDASIKGKDKASISVSNRP